MNVLRTVKPCQVKDAAGTIGTLYRNKDATVWAIASVGWGCIEE
jgi:hypothetical protein